MGHWIWSGCMRMQSPYRHYVFFSLFARLSVDRFKSRILEHSLSIEARFKFCIFALDETIQSSLSISLILIWDAADTSIYRILAQGLDVSLTSFLFSKEASQKWRPGTSLNLYIAQGGTMIYAKVPRSLEMGHTERLNHRGQNSAFDTHPYSWSLV